jgi:hypothetical protein
LTVEKEKKDKEEEKKAQELAAQGDAWMKGRSAACETAKRAVEELTFKTQTASSPEEVLNLGHKVKEALEMTRKLEDEKKTIPENKVGEKRIIVGNKVLKVAKIILAHMNPIDGRGKVDVQDRANKVNALLREKAITESTTPWHAAVEIGKGNSEDESK